MDTPLRLLLHANRAVRTGTAPFMLRLQGEISKAAFLYSLSTLAIRQRSKKGGATWPLPRHDRMATDPMGCDRPDSRRPLRSQ